MIGRKAIFIILILVGIFIASLIMREMPTKQQQTSTPPYSTPTQSTEQNESPKIISTKPDPLDQALISGSEVIEITFNKPLENAPELKLKIEPKVEYKVELSSDRKIAKITPIKTFDLGTTFTLFISPESKFDGGGRLDGEKIFHFHTVRYRGV